MKQMKKIVSILLGFVFLAGCGSNETKFVCTGSTTQNELKIIETLEMRAKNNDVTMIIQTMEYNMEELFKKPEFVGATPEQKKEYLKIIAEKWNFPAIMEESTVSKVTGEPLKGMTSSYEFVGDSIIVHMDKDLVKADFNQLNEINYFKGYDREVKGLFYDEELAALEKNGYSCTKTIAN